MLIGFFGSGWLSRSLFPIALCLSLSVSIQQDRLGQLLHQSDQIDGCGLNSAFPGLGQRACSWDSLSVVIAQLLLCAGSAFWEVSND